MTNEQRRAALNRARRRALEHAETAQEFYDQTSEDGPEATLANMWANVASAMKDGDPIHDSTDGVPIDLPLSLPLKKDFAA